MSPALAGGFLTTREVQNSLHSFFSTSGVCNPEQVQISLWHLGSFTPAPVIHLVSLWPCHLSHNTL